LIEEKTFMKKYIVAFVLIFSVLVAGYSQGSMPLMELKLAGKWQVDSVSFGRAVDINRDGIKNANAIKEYSSCLRVQQLSFNGDYSADSSIGEGIEGCTAKSTKFPTWILERKANAQQQKKYEQAKDKKSMPKPEKKIYLTLKAEDDWDNIEFEVIELSKDVLQVIGEVTFDDSSAPAMMFWRRIKK
jgi:hypothetical protein